MSIPGKSSTCGFKKKYGELKRGKISPEPRSEYVQMGDYLGKHIDEFSSFQRSIYKKYNDDGDKTWAYYYDSPAAPSRMDSFTIKRMTVFNLNTDRNGKIYGCTWARYSGGYHRDHGTDDWLTP